MSLQVGIDDCSIVSHPAPVCPAVTALYLIQACHFFQAQNVLKALLEVVWQESVQDGVGAAVSITKHHYKVKGALHSRGWVDWAGDWGDVENVERQPTEDEDRHHDGHHPCHLALRPLAFGGTHSYARWLHLSKKWTVSDFISPKNNGTIFKLWNIETL